MRYMLVNMSTGNIQVDLKSPDISYKNKNQNRPGTVISINLKRGSSEDILKYFNHDIEKAHASVKYSRDVLKLLRPSMVHIYTCDDQGNSIDIDSLLGKKKKDKKPVEMDMNRVHTDTTKPDLELSTVLAAEDHFEAKKRGETNDDDKKLIKKTSKKKPLKRSK